MSAISKHFYPEVLTSLFLKEIFGGPQMRPQEDHARLATYTIDFNTLRPVLAFVNMESVTLDLERKVTLDDCEMLLIAQGWPRLRTLRINSWHGWPAPGSCITFSGLAMMLAILPCIEDVSLSINASIPPPHPNVGEKEDASGSCCAPSSLKSINLLNSSKGNNAQDETTFLLHTLTNVTSCTLCARPFLWEGAGGVHVPPGTKEWWDNIFEALKTMRSGIQTAFV
ncbi:hypothetical protein CONPUDRAFT_152505 [Coniophora puteana RWD-64-598 SS2]|uniref:Uncharacterized protein n=1 Tax=Coniophora puteana (strain RWD-64-598) TaxID=741705 RepID=A0A5M3MWN7_CONPW|nr:uncharacterized protein CONPUDRAFT_152505 [Coniophora puteana RWD-64-598 SS2]EIW83480.1 hypothetical protein CONPUDRAFT_152505 [Coniophora puteana RWD-64-598 SS2]